MNPDLAALPHWFVLAAAFFFGGSFGSFLNVCVGRWPKELSVVRPPSRCPRCGAGIAWYDNLPVFSWFALRGKCRGCALPISPVYPLVELVVALIWVASALHFGPSLTALRVAVFGTILLGVMLVDGATSTIPDGFTVFGFFWGLILACVSYAEPSPFSGPLHGLNGAFVGAGSIAILGWLAESLLKREAMGFGDVTLMAMIGVYLGAERTLITFGLGAFLGAVFGIPMVLPRLWAKLRHGKDYEMLEVPFGVFLAPAAMIALLWGNDILAWLRSHYPYLPQL